jgi:hypothetical protein
MNGTAVALVAASSTFSGAFMKTKILALSSILCLSLLGCKPSDGVSGALTIKSKTTIVTPGGNKVALLGTYAAELQPRDNGVLVFLTSSKQNTQFKIPNFNPATEGNVSVPAKSLGQEFGLRGKIYSRTTPFDIVQAVSCVYDIEREYVCSHERRRPDGDGRRGRENCAWVSKEILGTQDERKVGETERKYLEFDLIRGNGKIGSFYGSKDMGEIVFSREIVSHCRRNGW